MYCKIAIIAALSASAYGQRQINMMQVKEQAVDASIN